MKTVRPESGFTLIEVMVALVILATSLVALLGLLNRDLTISSQINSLTKATLLGRQRMSEVMTGDFPEVGEDSGNFGLSYPGYTWRQEITETDFEQIRAVKVAVFWQKGGQGESMSFSNYFIDLK